MATFAFAGGEKQDCNTVVAGAIANVPDEVAMQYRNHGQYVRAVAAYLKSAWPGISEECHDCVMAGAAQSDLDNTSCNISQ